MISGQPTRRLLAGLIYSAMTIVAALISTLVLYRLLWVDVDQVQLVWWIGLFELLQFLLLADIGFTQNYIRQASARGAEGTSLDAEFQRLRLTMLAVGLVASAVVVAVVMLSDEGNKDALHVASSLGASILCTLAAYAETAYLRANQRFGSIARATIAAQIVFVASILLFSIDIVTVSWLIALRSLIAWIGQAAACPRYQRVAIRSVNLGQLGAIVPANGSYVSLFCFEAFLIGELIEDKRVAAAIIVLRKVFDLSRAFFDSAINVFSSFLGRNRFSWTERPVLELAILLASLMLGVFSPVLAAAWIGESLASLTYTLAFTFSAYYASGLLFRWATQKRLIEGRLRVQFAWNCFVIILNLKVLAYFIGDSTNFLQLMWLQSLVLICLVFTLGRQGCHE